MTEHDLTQRLRARYAHPEWAFFTQVYRPTSRGTRYADALALNLWSTRGLEFMGFEIKVDRRDWLRELKDPAKSEEVAEYCDRWWLVASDKDIVKDGELPRPWGMLIPHGDTLRIHKKAEKLTSRPLDRKFVSVLIRKFYEENAQRAHTDPVLQARFDEGAKAGRAAQEWEIQNTRKSLTDLQEAVRVFKTKSGVDINSWNADNIGDAVRLVMNDEHLRLTHRLEAFQTHLKQLLIDTEIAVTKSRGILPNQSK